MNTKNRGSRIIPTLKSNKALSWGIFSKQSSAASNHTSSTPSTSFFKKSEPRKHSITLTDLPFELLLDIFQYLQPKSLFSVCRSCRSLNTPAIVAFMSNSTPVRQFAAEQRTLSLYHSKRMISALRTALFMQNLRRFSCYINIRTMFEEVSDLFVFLARLQSIGEVFLDFEAYYHFKNYPRIDQEAWGHLFLSLLHVLMVRSCSTLGIMGADLLPELYAEKESTVAEQRMSSLTLSNSLNLPPEKPITPAPGLSVQPFAPLQLPDIQIDSDQPKEINRTSVVIKSGLRELYLKSHMLFQHPFLEWTFSTLKAESSTIQLLHLQTKRLSNSFWDSFLARLSFPHLNEFNIASNTPGMDLDIPFSSMEDFLYRHPTITVLHINNVELPSSPLKAKNGLLPNLRSLTSHPAYTVWILTPLSTKRPLSDLRSVGISSGSDQVHLSQFDAGLERIAQSECTNLTLHIGSLLSSYNTEIDSWLRGHVGAGYQSVMSSLIRVRFLCIRVDFIVNFNCETISLLPPWLRLLPNLEHVEFTRLFHLTETNLLQKGFIHELAKTCPKLKTMRIVGAKDRTIDMDLELQ